MKAKIPEYNRNGVGEFEFQKKNMLPIIFPKRHNFLCEKWDFY